MLELEASRKFLKEYDSYSKIIDISIVDEVIIKLMNNEILESKYKDHKLKGNLKDFRECHIKSDLLLMYQIKENTLYLARLGTHNALFKK